jgi:hypothetical protein
LLGSVLGLRGALRVRPLAPALEPQSSPVA